MLHQDVRSELAVPLEVMGEVRGVLNVDSRKPNAFSQSDQELLEELAVQAAKVIHNTWLFEQSRLKAGFWKRWSASAAPSTPLCTSMKPCNSSPAKLAR
jgi:transcriptional regulator with GAF, ATPase, and Fis domain